MRELACESAAQPPSGCHRCRPPPWPPGTHCHLPALPAARVKLHLASGPQHLSSARTRVPQPPLCMLMSLVHTIRCPHSPSKSHEHATAQVPGLCFPKRGLTRTIASRLSPGNCCKAALASTPRGGLRGWSRSRETGTSFGRPAASLHLSLTLLGQQQHSGSSYHLMISSPDLEKHPSGNRFGAPCEAQLAPPPWAPIPRLYSRHSSDSQKSILLTIGSLHRQKHLKPGG